MSVHMGWWGVVDFVCFLGWGNFGVFDCVVTVVISEAVSPKKI